MYEGIWKNAHDSNVKLFLEASYMILLWKYIFFWKKNSPLRHYIDISNISKWKINTKGYIFFKKNDILLIISYIKSKKLALKLI